MDILFLPIWEQSQNFAQADNTLLVLPALPVLPLFMKELMKTLETRGKGATACKVHLQLG